MNLFNYPGLTPEQQAQLRNQALLQAGAGILAGTQGSYGRAAPAIGAGIQSGLSSANSQAMQMQQMNQTVELLKQRKQDKKDKEAERKATEAFRHRQISYQEQALQETTRAAKAKEKYYPQRFSASTGGAGMGMGLGGYGMLGSIEDEVPPWMQGTQAAPVAAAAPAPTPEVPRGPQKPPMTSFLDMVSGQSSAPYRQQAAAPVAEQQPVQQGRYSPTQAKAFMASIERQIDRGDIKTREQALEKWELLDMLRGVVPANELELLKARLPNI